MATLGRNDLKNISLPTAWDNVELRRLQLRDGTTYEAMLRDIDDALSIVNSGMTSGWLANLFSLTNEPTVEYRNGVSNGFEDYTEYSQPDAKRAEVTGHMLPLTKQDRKLGWTYAFLKECRRAQIDADIASMADDAKNAFEKAVLTRLFKMEEETGKRYGLGSSGYSVPFADGGNGTIGFSPVPNPSRVINTFDTTHDHYLRLNGITQANLETAVGHLWEHGHDGPYDLLVALADLGDWQNTTNVTGFKKKPDPLITYGNSVDVSRVDIATYEGSVETKYGPCRLVANGRIPTTKWAVIKSYGMNDQRNPLRIRWDEAWGFGVQLVSQNVSNYPLMGAIGLLVMGVGVGEDRTAVVCVENDSGGDYASPTIS